MSYKMNDTVLFDSDVPGNIARFSRVIVGVHHADASLGSNGYTSGGDGDPGSTVNVIDKFPFSSDANAVDYGDLYYSIEYHSGQSSSTSGYVTGGQNAVPPFSFPPAENSQSTGRKTYIQKFFFGSGSSSAVTANLAAAILGNVGQSSSTHGYSSGGDPGPSVGTNVIEKFPFSADANATDIADLTQGRSFAAGQNSSTHGYTSGGAPDSSPTLGGNKVNTIDKFTFASDANATDVGDLTIARGHQSGQSSSSHGYSFGGYIPPPFSGVPFPEQALRIDKFPFSSDANATTVGDTSVPTFGGPQAGHSSSTHGYSSGGGTNSGVSDISKFPFSVDENSTKIGDLTDPRYAVAGHQG